MATVGDVSWILARAVLEKTTVKSLDYYYCWHNIRCMAGWLPVSCVWRQFFPCLLSVTKACLQGHPKYCKRGDLVSLSVIGESND